MGLTKTTLKRIQAVNQLHEQYGKMTVRQIYYQLVPSGLNYRQVQYAIQQGREHGLINVENIVDRSRPSYGTYKFKNLATFLEDSVYTYRQDYWADQDYKAEVWTEKDALSQIISEEAEPYRVPVRVTRGFLSTSNKHDWSNKNTIILYFGDFDPSGLWIDLDLKNNQFLDYLHFQRIALTFEQVQKQDLPYVKVKKKDPRAAEYIEQYGEKCWELDALPPDQLRHLVKTSIEKLTPFDLEEKQAQEHEHRRKLAEYTELQVAHENSLGGL